MTADAQRATLAALAEVWALGPDLRLGQLVAQRFFHLLPGGDVHDNRTDLLDVPAGVSNGVKSSQPVPDFSWLRCRLSRVVATMRRLFGSSTTQTTTR